MQANTAITTSGNYGDDMGEIGAIADSYARQNVFLDYQDRKPSLTTPLAAPPRLVLPR
jgi:hypothetical protein